MKGLLLLFTYIFFIFLSLLLL